MVWRGSPIASPELDRLGAAALIWASADVLHALVFAPPGVALSSASGVLWMLYLGAADS